MVGQTIGALVFSVFAGQPLVVVMTTAPLALFISVIFKIASDFEIDFLAFYAAIGLWNSFFLCLYSIFNMSILMKFSSRYGSHFLFSLNSNSRVQKHLTFGPILGQLRRFSPTSSPWLLSRTPQRTWSRLSRNTTGTTSVRTAVERHLVATLRKLTQSSQL